MEAKRERKKVQLPSLMLKIAKSEGIFFLFSGLEAIKNNINFKPFASSVALKDLKVVFKSNYMVRLWFF